MYSLIQKISENLADDLGNLMSHIIRVIQVPASLQEKVEILLCFLAEMLCFQFNFQWHDFMIHKGVT